MKTNCVTRKQLREIFNFDDDRLLTKLEKEGMPVFNLGYKTRRYDVDAVREWLQNRGPVKRQEKAK